MARAAKVVVMASAPSAATAPAVAAATATVTTVLAVHAEYAHRHPASLPVGIVTQCWAHRRATVRVRADGRMEVA